MQPRKIWLILIAMIIVCSLLAVIIHNRPHSAGGSQSSESSPEPETQPAESGAVKCDWTMYATEFTSEGEIAETLKFTLQIADIYSSDGNDYLSLDFSFPDGYRYSLDYDTPYVSYGYRPYFVCDCFALDTQAGTPASAAFALSIDRGMMVICWRNSDRCLAASIGPNIDPQEILDYFRDFIETCMPSSSGDAD